MSLLESNNEESRAPGTKVTRDMDAESAAADGTSVQESPRMPVADALGPAELRDAVSLLRRFHLGEPGAGEATRVPDETHIPLALSNIRNLTRFRYEYPLLLSPSDEDILTAKPLDRFLADALSEGTDRIVEDNLSWIETHIRDVTYAKDETVPARELIAEAGEALQNQVDPHGPWRDILKSGIDGLIDSVTPGSVILPYGPNVVLHLLRYALEQFAHWQRRELTQRVAEALKGLQRLVDTEAAKTAKGDVSGEGSRFLSNASLAGVLNRYGQGPLPMEADRLKRIKTTLGRLRRFQVEERPLQLIARAGRVPFDSDSSVTVLESTDPCAKAQKVYDKIASKYLKVFANLRIARLDMADGYDASFHDSWFERFDADEFSDEERQLIPAVVGMEDVAQLAGKGMRSLSAALGSSKPVQILINVNPHINPGQDADTPERLRLELASLGMGHRLALINQASAARHEPLLSGILDTLDGRHACLHLADSGFADHQPLHPWIVASAALESRAHPFVRFDPDGDDGAGRMTFAGNPHADRDWAVHPVAYIDGNNGLVETEHAFTFADYCLLNPEFHRHFRLVPTGCQSSNLVTVEDYLNASTDNQVRLIPTILAVNGDGLVQTLVVSRRLVAACLDRLNYWRSLQSRAGIRNAHVDLAVRQTRDEEHALAAEQRLEAEGEREQLVRSHEEELERVRSESVSAISSRLTSVLMGLEEGVPITAAPVTTEETIADESDEAPVEVAEEAVSEPWVDSIFCTTCDDCMRINKQLFVYNDDRQAIMADLSLGTFAEIVEAAEICPASCIHPGSPPDPSEPGLEELIERAKQYQ